MHVAYYRDKHGKIISGRVIVYGGKDKDGKEVRFRETFKVPHDKRAPSKAKKYLAEKGLEFEKKCLCSKPTTPIETPSFKEYSESWMENKANIKMVKASTLARYSEILDRINNEFGEVPLSSITPTMISEFYAALSSPGANKKTGGCLSPKTVREHHIVISSILARAVRYGLIHSNPADIAKEDLPSLSKPQIEKFEPEELRKLLSCAEEEPIKWRTLLNVFAVTGLRRGEVLGLQWSDVDIDSDPAILRVKTTVLYTVKNGIYIDAPKTEDSIRTLRIPDRLVVMLKDYRLWQKNNIEKLGDAYTHSDYIFTTTLGGNMHPDSVTDYMHKFEKKYNLPFHVNPHKFRHTVASILIYKGIDIVTVSAYLGHSDPSITSRVYAHMIKDALAKASDAIGEVLLE